MRPFPLLLILGLLALSCGRGGGGTEARPTFARSGQDFAAVGVPRERLADARAAASSSEQRSLEDGVITFAEYEAAALATVNCWAEAGIGVTSPPYLTSPPRPGLILLARGQYRYSPDFETQGYSDALASRVASCVTEHSGVLQPLWIELTSPTVEEFASARADIGACLRQAGIAIAEAPSQRELNNVAFPPDGIARGRAIDPTYRACIEPVIREYGLVVMGAAF